MVVVVALLLPVLLVLMLFGLDTLENFLLPRHTERFQTDTEEPLKPL
ncbi:hypothetical protein ACWC9T_40970 [Kitasatospora sp. NPDC001159]